MKFQLNTNPENRANVINYMTRTLAQLPIDESYSVSVSELKENRRLAQNRLMWVWNTEIGQEYGKPAEQAHNESKLEILHPLMLEIDRLRDVAIEHRDIIAALGRYEQRVLVAGCMIRTKDLYVREFRDYLERMQIVWAERGFVLSVKNRFYDDAFGR